MGTRRDFLKMLSIPAAGTVINNNKSYQSLSAENPSVTVNKNSVRNSAFMPLDNMNLTIHYLDDIGKWMLHKHSNRRLMFTDILTCGYFNMNGFAAYLCHKIAEYTKGEVLYYACDKDFKEYWYLSKFLKCFPDIECLGALYNEPQPSLNDVLNIWEKYGILLTFSKPEDTIKDLEELVSRKKIKFVIIDSLSSEKNTLGFGKISPEERIKLLFDFAVSMKIRLIVMPDYTESYFYSDRGLYNCISTSSSNYPECYLGPDFPEKFEFPGVKLTLHQKNSFELLNEPKIVTGDVALVLHNDNTVLDLFELEYFTYISPNPTTDDEYGSRWYHHIFSFFCDLSEERSRYRKDYYKRFLKGKLCL